jgi:hypothetical protein
MSNPSSPKSPPTNKQALLDKSDIYKTASLYDLIKMTVPRD